MLLSHFLLFTLVLTRVSGLVMTAPIYGSQEVPMRIRALLAFSLAVLLTPLHWGAKVAWPANVPQYMALILGEVLIGIALGVGILVLFSGVQLAGQLISQTSGMALGEVFNPGLDSEIPLFSQLFHLLALAVFVLIGGHRLVMEGLLGTLVTLPPGSGGIQISITHSLSTLMMHSFDLSIRAAAPATTALLLTTLVLGLISRTLPQLNVMALGFGLNSFVTFAALALGMGGIAWAFQEQLGPTLDLLLEGLHDSNVGNGLRTVP